MRQVPWGNRIRIGQDDEAPTHHTRSGQSNFHRHRHWKEKESLRKLMETAKNVCKINLSQDMVESNQCPRIKKKGAAWSQYTAIFSLSIKRKTWAQPSHSELDKGPLLLSPIPFKKEAHHKFCEIIVEYGIPKQAGKCSRVGICKREILLVWNR